ncbi:hypothetical protein Clacol_000562 [Clathrus columnatus]|uniref:Cyclin-domain-containing protein n=1 Tax=Clathrus columnatus TaxID=1419009 RepID=A0AAV5A020_9AGAM|nr:hypothetical protein Clacol_000562 [Clathrus columnatus]
MCARVARFTISSLTVHRFLISSITVSSKALCDVFCKNSYYARVGGLRVVELNILEKELLAFLDWRLTCTRDLLQEYYANLVRTHSTGLFRLSEEPVSTPSNNPPDSPNQMARSRTITPVQGPDSDELTVLAPRITPMTIAEPSNVLMGKAPGHIASPHLQQGVTALEKNMAFAALHSPDDVSPKSPRVEKRSNAHFTEVLGVHDIRPSKRKAGDTENERVF